MHSQSDEVASTLRDTVSIAKRCLITEELSYLHASIAEQLTKPTNTLIISLFNVLRLSCNSAKFASFLFLSNSNISFLSHFVAIVANLHTFPFGAIPLGLF